MAAPFNGEEIEATVLCGDRPGSPPEHLFKPGRMGSGAAYDPYGRRFFDHGRHPLFPGVFPAAREALGRGSLIYCDSNMIRSGLSLARLRRINPVYGPGKIVCYVADEGVAAEARATGLPRSLLGMRKARPLLNDAIVVFGNAPIALLELNRMILEEGLRPALVIGLPVGFVHVVESKEELLTLPVPFITLTGRRGGAPWRSA